MKSNMSEIKILKSCSDVTSEIKGILTEFPKENLVISFEKAIYRFYDTDSYKESYYPSNNDGGIKSIVFLLKDYKNIVIDGNNSEFLINGRISPFIIDNSQNITLKNMIIDCERPYFSQGEIIDAGKDFVVLKIDKDEFPYKIQGTNLIFYSEFWQNDLSEITVLMQEFSPETKAPAFMGHTALAKIGKGRQNTQNLPAEFWELEASQMADGNVMLSGKFSYIPKIGNYLIMTHEKRENSFCFIKDSKDITLQNVVIHHIGSMGVIAQHSKNITVSDCSFALREGSKRLISTNADATHFVNCYGKIHIKNTILENMMDDGGNIHGIYTIIEKIKSNREIIVSLRHFQQQGVQIFSKGDIITIYDPVTLKILATPKIKSTQMIALNQISIVFEKTVADINLDNIVENTTKMPEVLIENCRTGNNRPRGFLINTPKNAIIRNNTFYNSSSGIQLNGDINYWYESGFTKDVLIENNRFSNCCYIYDDPPIMINPDFLFNDNKTYFHSKVKILNNIFEIFNDTIISAKSVENLTVLDNTIIKTTKYERSGVEQQQIVMVNCKYSETTTGENDSGRISELENREILTSKFVGCELIGNLE